MLVYIDDLLIFLNNIQEHERHLRKTLTRLQRSGLIVQQDKCVFVASTVEFLGHQVSAKGLRSLPSKVSAIQNYPVPTSIKELQAFIGMVNFYHQFIPMAATHMAPLYQDLTGKPTNFLWKADQQLAFNHTKQALAEAAIIGAVLKTIVSNVPQPLSFYSHTLHRAESNYSTLNFDKELLAVHSAIRHFWHMLEGSQFTIQTDHQPLVTAVTKSGDAWSARQQ